MFWLLFVFYVLIIIIPFCKRGKKDWFSPWVMYSVLMIVNTVPFLLISHYNKEIVTGPVLEVIKSNYDSVILKFIINQSLFNIVYFFSYNRFKFKCARIGFFNLEMKARQHWAVCVCLSLCSLLYTFYFISSVGGIDGLLLIYNDREALQGDRTLWFVLINFAVYLAGAFHVKYMSIKGFSGIQLFINIIIALIVLSSQGGRSPFVLYLINIAVCYNYFIKRINLLSLKYVPIYLGVVGFIIGIFLLRTQGLDDITVYALVDNLSVFLSGSSYVDIQALIINFFEKNEFWYGESYRGLLGILIPKSLYPDKMPIDEGVYIHEMIYNYKDVLGCKDFYTSYPPATLGAMYSNFGYVGIVFGGFLLGLIHKYAYSLFLNTKNVFIVFIYVFLVVKFQLTVFYIAHFTYNIILLTFFYSIIKFFSRTTSRRKSYSKVIV